MPIIDDTWHWPIDVVRVAQERADEKAARDPEGERWARALTAESKIWLKRICKSSRRGTAFSDAPALVQEQLRQYVKIVEPKRQMVRPTPMGKRLYQALLDYQARQARR